LQINNFFIIFIKLFLNITIKVSTIDLKITNFLNKFNKAIDIY
jgi:hypothetical protein